MLNKSSCSSWWDRNCQVIWHILSPKHSVYFKAQQAHLLSTVVWRQHLCWLTSHTTETTAWSYLRFWDVSFCDGYWIFMRNFPTSFCNVMSATVKMLVEYIQYLKKNVFTHFIIIIHSSFVNQNNTENVRKSLKLLILWQTRTEGGGADFVLHTV